MVQMHTVLSGKIIPLRIDDKDFSQRPEQQPKEKAIEEARILLLQVQSLVTPTLHTRLLMWRSFRKLLGVK